MRPINGKCYLVTDIEESGAYLVIQETDLELGRLVIGDTIPNFEFKLLNDSLVSLYDYIDTNKFTVIDVWGSWCKGCIMQIPRLQALDSAYTDTIQIIALNMGDNKEGIYSIINEHKITWVNGIVSNEILENLLVDGYPYLLLLDKQKRIVLPQTRISNIREVINK